ncbi:MAG: ABC transporter permease [Propionibacteriaceae bacterium]|nr:ABC transporter permease [Micropruina sp.]HBX82533.1 peptide ABC transporter permease [Propionibacteriaceae bacterium]HBY22336.1 peptide ABC transporter permease [Propionibacteriaceae bacterium]
MNSFFGRLLAPFRNTTGLARWILVTGLIITGTFVIAAIFAPILAPYGFAQMSVAGVDFPKTSPPGPGHLFGTNNQFYDILSRVIWGAQTAISVVLLSVVLSALIGVPLGLLSGYVGRWTDRILVFIMDALYAFPSLLLAIVFAFLLQHSIGSGVISAALSLTVIYIPQYFRVVRNTTVSAREATYVEAARALGAKNGTIMGRYLFSNVIQSVPVIATLNAADAISTLAALGFLGLGIQPTDASEWGYDLSRALQDASAGIWWTGFFPGMAIVGLVMGLTLVGEGLNETINPTLRKRRFRKVTLPPRTPGREEVGS